MELPEVFTLSQIRTFGKSQVGQYDFQTDHRKTIQQRDLHMFVYEMV